MPSCSVKWCVNHTSTCSLKSKKGVSFHKFPRDKELCQKWVNAVRLERHDPWWNSTKASRICSIHFKKSDMLSTPCKVNVLNKSAVPICTMVWYDRDSNVSSNLSLPTENINLGDNITKANELKETYTKVPEESNTNVSADNDERQDSDKVFDILKETKKQRLSRSQERELTNERTTSEQESKDEEKSIDMAEFIKFNTKDTCVKLNDNTSIILKKDVNEESIDICQVPNTNTCETKDVEVEKYKLLGNKESKVDGSDEPITDPCSGEIQQIDLKYTFIGKILKTYLPKRKFKKSRQKNTPEVYKYNDENKLIDIRSNDNDLTKNLFNETEINFNLIRDSSIYDTEPPVQIIDENNRVLFKESLVNNDDVDDGKESRRTNFNDIHLDIVGKQIIIDKESINDMCNESIENMCDPTSREFRIETSFSVNNNMKDSNTHLILDLDTQLYTETNTVDNIIDSMKECCEFTNEQNNQQNGVTETALITELIDTNESVPLSDDVNSLSHANELSLINISDPIQTNNDLISESEYEILTGFDNNAPESQQNNVILNNTTFPTENDLFNTDTSENIDIGLENLQYAVKLNSTLNTFDPKKGEHIESFVNIESSLNNSNLYEIKQLSASKIDKEGMNFLGKGVRINTNDYEDGDLEHPSILQKDVLTTRENEKNNVIENNLIWGKNQDEIILSANLKFNNYSHCENNYAIQSNDRSDRQLSELCNVDNNKTHNETYFPELLKHLTAKPKMDSLVDLCTNSLTEIDKKIFSKYGNMALVNKKRLQDIYGYDGEEIYKNLDLDNDMTENNINVGEEEQFNTVTDQLESNIDDSMDLINGLDPSITEQILNEETITSSNNLIETVDTQLKDKVANITDIGELLQNEILTIPEDTTVKINENISEGLTNNDLGKLCGKIGLDFENASPISGISEENIVDEDIQVIENNLDIDKENTSEFDFSLLLDNSLPDSEPENPDDNFDCNDKNSPADLMDLATVDIPESIDGILDEEGSLFGNLDLLENSSLDSNEELKTGRNEVNINGTENNEKPLSVPSCDELKEYLSIENICEMEKEQSNTCVQHNDSKAKKLVGRLIESSRKFNLNTLELPKERFAGNCCVSLKELYNETLEQYRVNLENIKKHILDECYNKKIKDNISISNGQLFKSFPLNEAVSSDVPVDLRGIEFGNDINLLQKINYSGTHGTHEVQGQKNEEVIDELVDLGDILFKNDVTPFSMELENQGSELKSLPCNKNDPIELNLINNQKNLYELEQEEGPFNDQDVDMSNIDIILDEICSDQCLETENESLDQMKEHKSNNNNNNNKITNMKENSKRILKDLYNKSVEMSRSFKKGKHSASVGCDSPKISTVTGRRLSVEQLKREIFDQCFSSECDNNCKKRHHNTAKNKMSLFKTQNIEIPNNFDIKKQSKKKQKHSSLYRRQSSTKKQKNKSTCLSPSKEKIKLKYKEYSIDLLKGQCFEFSQKEIEDESNLNEKKIKRKCNDPTLESRKIQCTESMVEENKCGQSLELTLKKHESTDIDGKDSDCSTLKELDAECPNCGFVTNEDDVDLSIKEPLTVINKGMLLSNMEKKCNENDGNKNVPLRSVYAMELAYITAIQALQRKLKKKMAVCDYRLRKMNNLAHINNRLIKDNISLKCKTKVIQNKI